MSYFLSNYIPLHSINKAFFFDTSLKTAKKKLSACIFDSPAPSDYGIQSSRVKYVVETDLEIWKRLRRRLSVKNETHDNF